MVSFHGSVFGRAGVTVWHWGLTNIGGTGINFAPFEPAGGWVQTADSSSARSVVLARKMIKSLKDAGIPLIHYYKKTTTGGYLPEKWALPEPLASETGVIFASAFPVMESLINEVTGHFNYKNPCLSHILTGKDLKPAR